MRAARPIAVAAPQSECGVCGEIGCNAQPFAAIALAYTKFTNHGVIHIESAKVARHFIHDVNVIADSNEQLGAVIAKMRGKIGT